MAYGDGIIFVRHWQVARDHKKSLKMRQMYRYDKIKDNLYKVGTLNDKYYEIHFYGSRVSGLGHKESDLDIFVEIDDGFYSVKTKKTNAVQLHSINNRLNSCWKTKILLEHSTCPVLRVKYLPLDLDCDIVVANGLGVKNSALIDHLFSLQSQARYFYHFIRLWMNANGPNIRTYTLTLLIIFFLQTRNLMPSIETVQEDLKEITIDGWNVSFDASRDTKYYGCRRMGSYQNYLIAFFSFYEDYAYENFVISTYLGESVSRRSYNADGFKIEKAMCIAGPINQGYNCAYDIGKDRLRKIRKTCANAVSFLEDRGFKREKNAPCAF